MSDGLRLALSRWLGPEERVLPVVTMAGAFYLRNVDQLRAFFESRLSWPLSEGHELVVLELSGLKFIDSRGLHALSSMAYDMTDAGGAIWLADAHPRCAELLEVMTLWPLFGRCEPWHDALWATGQVFVGPMHAQVDLAGQLVQHPDEQGIARVSADALLEAQHPAGRAMQALLGRGMAFERATPVAQRLDPERWPPLPPRWGGTPLVLSGEPLPLSEVRVAETPEMFDDEVDGRLVLRVGTVGTLPTGPHFVGVDIAFRE